MHFLFLVERQVLNLKNQLCLPWHKDPVTLRLLTVVRLQMCDREIENRADAV